MLSERLRYHRLGPSDLRAFHHLVRDEQMARAAIEQARGRPGFEEIVADVDEVNAGSLRVIETLGFERVAVQPGAFGNLLLLRLPAGR